MPDLFRLSDVDGSVRLVVSIDPEPGVGTVDSVTAADGTIVIAGTAADPTVAVGEVTVANIDSEAAASGDVPTADGSGGVAWAPQAGGGGGITELAYAQVTTAVSAVGLIVACAPVTLTGSETLMVNFFCAEVANDNTGGSTQVKLHDGGTVLGQIGYSFFTGLSDTRASLYGSQRLTGLTAGDHTFGAYLSSIGGSSNLFAGDGIGGDLAPMFLQVLQVG